MNISEILNRVSTAITDNDLSNVIDDVQMLIGEIDNLNTTINSLNSQIEDLTTNNTNLNSEIESNRKTIAKLVRQIPVKDTQEVEEEKTDYEKILKELVQNAR